MWLNGLVTFPEISGIREQKLNARAAQCPLMPDKRPKYSIYGFTPGTTSHPQSPIGGSQQPVEARELEDVKTEVEHILQGLAIVYPIRSKREFLDVVSADLPGLCVVSGDDQRPALASLLWDLSRDLPAISDALAGSYLTHAALPRQLAEER